jgi:hypothetical protein
MGLKMEETIKRLPSTGYNIYQAMKESGYSSATCRSGAQYALIRKRIAKAYDPEQIKADIRRYERKFEKEQDNSNLSRMVELRSKIAGLTKENNTQVNAVIVDAIKELKQTEPIPSVEASGEVLS